MEEGKSIENMVKERERLANKGSDLRNLFDKKMIIIQSLGS